MQPGTQFVAPQGPDRLYSIASAMLSVVFTLMSAYYMWRIAKIGIDMAGSGDNPQAQAAAKASLGGAILGGVIFFGAAIATGVIWWLTRQ